MKIVKRILISISVVAFSSCATLDLSRINDLSLRKSPDLVNLKPSYEVFLLREDLVRATHSETTTSTVNGRTVTTTRQVPNEYSELAIDFGNGIIMDYNSNLCVDLIKLYNIDISKGFSIERSGTGLFNGKKYFNLRNNKFDSNYESKRNVTFEDNEIKIESGLLKIKRRIIIDDNKIQLVGKFLGININMEALQNDDKTIDVKGFWKDDKFAIREPGRVTMNKYFEIKNQDDFISITYTGIFGITTSMKCFITKTGMIFTDKKNKGVEIIRDKNSIQVTRNKKLVAEYVIK